MKSWGGYNVFITVYYGFVLTTIVAIIGIFTISLLHINKKECLHCGKDHADYCEKCYQDLIAKNTELQIENDCFAKGFKETMQSKFNKAIEERGGKQ